jgi:3-oxoadipate enol-lactonase
VISVSGHGGCRLNVSREGRRGAPVLVLSHQLGGTLSVWDAQVAAWRDRFDIVRYDTRGQGKSDAPTGPYNVDMLGGDALTVMDALNIPSCTFIGLSQGGMTGMWLAVHQPQKIEKLVLANTTPFIPNKIIWDELADKAQREGLTGIARSTLESWLSAGFKMRSPGTMQRLIEDMQRMTPAGYAANCAVLRDIDLRNRLIEIACPTLVIGGAEDGPRGASAPVMASGVRAGRLVVLPDAAHLSPVENPALFNRTVEEFLA